MTNVYVDDNLIAVHNGVKIFHRNTESPLVHMVIHVAVGSSIECGDELGISHFIEHTIFTGTSKYKNASEVSEKLKLTGTNWNAHTSESETVFYFTCLVEDFQENFEFLLHIFSDCQFFESEVKREMQPVLSEIRSYDDSPTDVLYRNCAKAMYNKNPIVGFVNTVEKFTSEKLKTFRDTHYYNAGIRIGVRGGVDENSVIAICTANQLNFSDNNIELAAPKFVPGKTIYKKDDLQEAHYYRFYDIGGLGEWKSDEKRRLALCHLMNVLGGTAVSRLNKRIRMEAGLSCYGVYAGQSTEIDYGYVWISGQISPTETEKFTALIDEEIQKLITDGVTIEEIRQFAKSSKMGIILNYSNDMKHIQRSLSRDADGLSISVKESIDLVDELTSQELKDVGKYLTTEYHEGWAVPT